MFKKQCFITKSASVALYSSLSVSSIFLLFSNVCSDLRELAYQYTFIIFSSLLGYKFTYSIIIIIVVVSKPVTKLFISPLSLIRILSFKPLQKFKTFFHSLLIFKNEKSPPVTNNMMQRERERKKIIKTVMWFGNSVFTYYTL